MADFFVGDELWNFRDRHQPRRQILAVIELHAVLQPAVFHEHGEAVVGQNGRVGVNATKQARIFALIPGFLA